MTFHNQLTELQSALEKGDGLEYIGKLYELTRRLNKPCLRLRILQQVLGLDSRFSRDIVRGVICLAFDALEDISNRARHRSSSPSAAAATTSIDTSSVPSEAAQVPSLLNTPLFGNLENEPSLSPSSSLASPPSPPSSASSPTAAPSVEPLCATLDLDGYDEATRMEADALLGSPRPRRPSDPLGDENRRVRVLYHYR
jgi:hypothetical protein